MALWLYGNGLGRHYGYGTMELWNYVTMAQEGEMVLGVNMASGMAMRVLEGGLGSRSCLYLFEKYDRIIMMTCVGQ
jgi:hypothetical protein